MAKQQKILLRRSSVKGKMPSSATGSSVEIGELLLNNASGDAENFLTTLKAGGSSAVTSDYIKWSDDATNEKKFATKGELEDSEFVTATALNQINASVGLTEGGISQLPNQQTLTEAIIDLQNKTQDLEESDPIFTDSPAAGITGDDIENWDNKLDKYGKAVSAQTADSATTSVSATTAVRATNLDGNPINKFMTYTISDEYVGARLNTSESQKAADTYIEYWGSHGWYNSKWGTITVNDKFIGNLQGKAVSAITSVSATTANKVDKLLKVGPKNYDGSSEVTITAADLGLETALKYHGVTTTPLTDGATTKPITIGGTNHYQSAGCVVIYSTTASGSTEFVWNGNKWEKLGDGINYKVKQEAVSEPVANGSALTFIDTISQDTNGVITATKKAVNLSHNHDTVYWRRTERVNSASTADSAIKDGSGNNIVSTYATKSSIPTSATVSNWGFTKNAGTVTSVKVQGTNGLTGSGTVTASGTITISGITATSAATGVSKLVTGDLNGKTYTKGEAAAAAHTHSQYLTGLPSHNHDDRYYTESEIDTKLAGKSDTGHTHPEYATTTALNDLIGDIEDNELVISTIVTKINDSCGFDENSESVLPNGQKLTEAIIELQGQLPVTLPTASTTTLGIMKVGSFLTATTGNVSVSTGTTSSTVARGDHGHAASSITSGTFNTARIPTGITVSKAISATTSVSATTSRSATTVYSTTANSKVYLVGVTGTGSSYQQLYKNTGVTMSASCIYATSDERLKDFKGDIECDLEKLKNIPKKYFSWKDDESKTIQIGTSAQEVHKLYPEIVSIDDDGTHSVAYDRLSIVALSAIDKLYDMVKELQAKNDELENRIKELENK